MYFGIDCICDEFKSNTLAYRGSKGSVCPLIFKTHGVCLHLIFIQFVLVHSVTFPYAFQIVFKTHQRRNHWALDKSHSKYFTTIHEQ